MKLTLLQKLALRSGLFSILALLVFTLTFYLLLDPNVLNVSLGILLYVGVLYLIYVIHLKKYVLVQLNRVYTSNLFNKEPIFKKNIEDINFESFIDEIREFAEKKHQEIEKLHNRDDFRKEFIGDVSHELKTPLFMAQGYLLTLLGEDLDDPALRKKYLERANKSIERLTYIVKDLDMIAKLESGMKLDKTRFNLLKVIDEVFDLMELKADKKNINLTFKETYNFPVFVKADKEKIEQVIINLLSNSIKYGKVGGSTMVELRIISDEILSVDVIDDGVGIADDQIPRLFERFYRVDKSRSREQGGSGLGLAIVKHIIEAHDLDIAVKSEPGSGSTFSFTLNRVV